MTWQVVVTLGIFVVAGVACVYLGYGEAATGLFGMAGGMAGGYHAGRRNGNGNGNGNGYDKLELPQ